MGSGGMIVMDDHTCIVDVAKYFTEFTNDESCGKCSSCREGSTALLEILEKICEGEGTEEDLRTLETVAGSAIVVACGAGIVEDPANIETLRAHGSVAWLNAPVRVLAERVGDGGGRPLLAGDTRARLIALQRRRRKAYEAAAHHRFDAEGSPGEIAREVVKWWRSTL